MIAAVVFWVSLAVLVYTYAGYPIVMFLRARARVRTELPPGPEPLVSIVIVAHNEASRIAGRLENLLGLDYPRDRLEILVASDGSTDDTVERARAYEDAGVKVVPFAVRRGKPAVLSDVVPTAKGDVVALADARQRFDRGSLRLLVRPFSDPRIGAVSGELVLETSEQDPSPTGEGLGFYWHYEKFIRTNESQVDSTVGVTGAIYAIRRELFEPIPADTLLDDVVIPMRIVRRGYRVIFQRGAWAYDRAATKAADEFVRKTRTIAGNYQLFVQERWLLDPTENRLWFQTVSHKLLRLLSPAFLATLWISNLLLLDSTFGALSMGGQIVFYTLALGGHLLRNQPHRSPVISVPYVFCVLNWTTVVAFFRFLTNRERVTWEKAPLEAIEKTSLTGAGPRREL